MQPHGLSWRTGVVTLFPGGPLCTARFTLQPLKQEIDQKLAAAEVLQCLTAMGQRQSSPVLEILRGTGSIEQKHKYPDIPISFHHDLWRTYFHVHDYPGRPAEEYGHFHIFTRHSHEVDFAHAVALTIDEYGQPLRWLAVNRWVTDGPWANSATISDQLIRLGSGADDPVAIRWLTAMLRLYAVDILQLLDERDQNLEIFCREHDLAFAQAVDNRGLYELVNVPINLKQRLVQLLNSNL